MKKWSCNVVIISGFLGAGKTTLVQAILRDAPKTMKIAVVVNDLAAVNIDAAEIKKSTSDMVELTNGCICCNLRGELLAELVKIHKQKKFTHIVVECTGVAEPMQVAETFFLPAAGQGKRTLQSMGLIVTSCVTMVDAAAFGTHMRGKVAQLLTEQVEFANVVIVNKIDIAPPKTTSEVMETIKRMNPRARVETSKFSEVPDVSRLLAETPFSLAEAELQGEWMQCLDLYIDHSESDVYDISSFVYRRQRPFHPARLHGFLFGGDAEISQNSFGQVLRMKGYVWIGAAKKHDFMGYANLSGTVVTVQPAGKWISALTDAELPSDLSAEEIAEVRKDWLGDGFTFDRRQELVVIGHGKEVKGLQGYLDTLLMTPEEVKAGLLSETEDPFGDWNVTGGPSGPEEGHTHGGEDGTVCYGDHGSPAGKRRKTKN